MLLREWTISVALILLLMISLEAESTSFPNWKARLARPYDNDLCATDGDCMYLGECQVESGKCKCSPGFKGSHCHELDLLPTDIRYGFNNASMPSWGATVIKHQGEYHMVASYMVRNCDIASYGTNSAIMRATSKTPQGPYKYQETLLEPFHHGAALIQDKARGKFYLYADGRTIPTRYLHTCKENSLEKTMPTRTYRDPNQKTGIWRFGESPHDFVSAFESDKLASGTWTRNVVLRTNLTAGSACNRTNPAPLLEEDGSVLLVFRTTYCDKSGNLCQPSPTKNCQHMYRARLSSPKDAPEESEMKMIKQLDGAEDPFIWKDRQGRFHLLVHSKNACAAGPDTCSLLAASANGVEWTSASRPAYATYVTFRTASNALVRERVTLIQRPKILFDETSGNPLFFICGFRRTSRSHIQTLMIPFNVRENAHLVWPGEESADEVKGAGGDSAPEVEPAKGDVTDEGVEGGDDADGADSSPTGDDEPSPPPEDVRNDTVKDDTVTGSGSPEVQDRIDFDSLPVSARKGGFFGWAFAIITLVIIVGVRLSVKYWKSSGHEYVAVPQT